MKFQLNSDRFEVPLVHPAGCEKSTTSMLSGTAQPVCGPCDSSVFAVFSVAKCGDVLDLTNDGSDFTG